MFSRRYCLKFVAVLASVVVALAAAPAGAVIDHEAAIIDLQLDGFVPAPPEVEGTGRIDHMGNLAPPGWTPPEGASFVGGYKKTWISLHTGHAIVIAVAEYKSVEVATIDKNRSVAPATFEEAGAIVAGPTPVDVSGIPDATGATATTSDGEIGLDIHMIAFTKGAITYAVGTFSDPGTMDVATALDVASQQYAFAPTVDPVVAATPANETGSRESESPADEAGRILGGLVMSLVMLFFLCGVGVIVFRLVRPTKPRQIASPPPGWSMQPRPPQPHPHSYAPQQYAPPPYAPPPHAPPLAHSAPAPPASTAVVPSATATADASPWTPPDATAPAPAAASRPCPSCGQDFGPTAACAHCGAARTSCVVCDVKVWAGALTCAAHART